MSFSRIFDILQHSLKNQPKFKKAFDQAIIFEKWPEIVGKAIATHASLSRIAEDGILYIAVDHTLWTSEIINRKLAILEKLNTHPALAQMQTKITGIKCFSTYQNRPFKKTNVLKPFYLKQNK